MRIPVANIFGEPLILESCQGSLQLEWMSAFAPPWTISGRQVQACVDLTKRGSRHVGLCRNPVPTTSLTVARIPSEKASARSFDAALERRSTIALIFAPSSVQAPAWVDGATPSAALLAIDGRRRSDPGHVDMLFLRPLVNPEAALGEICESCGCQGYPSLAAALRIGGPGLLHDRMAGQEVGWLQARRVTVGLLPALLLWLFLAAFALVWCAAVWSNDDVLGRAFSPVFVGGLGVIGAMYTQPRLEWLF